MAQLLATDAETGIYSAEGWTRAGAGQEVVRDNTLAHNGSWSWLVGGDTIAKSSFLTMFTTTTGRTYFAKWWCRVGALPAAEQQLHCQVTIGATTQIRISITPTGTLKITAAAANGITDTVSNAITAGTWFKLEMALYYMAPSNFTWLAAIAKLNNIEFGRWFQRTAQASTTPQFRTLAASGYPIRLNNDDIVIKDDTGTSNNYWDGATKPLTTGKTAASVRSTSTFVASGSTSTSLVVNAPSSNPGDLLIALLQLESASAVTIAPPTGWTVRAQTLSTTAGTLAIATKTAIDSEPGTHTFTLSPQAVRAQSVAYALQNVNTANPIIDSSAASTANAGNPVGGFPILDLPEGDALVMQVAGITSPNGAPVTAITPATTLTDTVFNNDTSTTTSTLYAGVYTKTDGGIAGTDTYVPDHPITAGTGAAIAFRGVVPQQNRFMAVA